MCKAPKIDLDDEEKIVPVLKNSKLDGVNNGAAKGYQSLLIRQPTSNTNGVSSQASGLTING